jgi:hypothetical protein
VCFREEEMYVPNQINTDTFKSMSIVGWKLSSMVSNLNQSLGSVSTVS